MICLPHLITLSCLSSTPSLGLKQVVDIATRITSTSSSHIYVSSDLTHSECVNLPPLPESDNNTLQITLTSHHIPQRKSKRMKIWIYKKADFDTANSTLKWLPSSIFSSDNVNNYCAEWSDVFTTVMTETIPTKQFKLRSKVPYLTDKLLHFVRKNGSLQSRKTGWHSQSMIKVHKNQEPCHRPTPLGQESPFSSACRQHVHPKWFLVTIPQTQSETQSNSCQSPLSGHTSQHTNWESKSFQQLHLLFTNPRPEPHVSHLPHSNPGGYCCLPQN